jgi:hypothetical protein
MKTEQIFQEFEQRLEKEYYAQLASKEILTVPLLIEIFLDDDYANAHWAEQVLEYIYDALASKTPAEFSIACDCAVSVFINKADEQKKLLDILKKSAEHKFYIGDTEIENSGEIAKEKVQLFLERIMNYKTKAENNC